MHYPAIGIYLFVLSNFLFPFRIQANDLYVSTNGTPSGPGTMARPYDLVTALSGQVGQPGDTFWLRSGNHSIGHIDTKIEGAPGQPITFRQMPGERARVDGSLTFYQSRGNIILRDFELYSSDTNRLSIQTGVGFNPTDIKIIPGIAAYSPNLSFINLAVHDHTRHGFYISQMGSNTLIYGCLVYNNGWMSPDNAEGHGMYVQGVSGTKEVTDNLVFNNSGASMHIYENATNRHLAGVTLDGNVAFNAGAIQRVRSYRDWIVGVDAPALSADRIALRNNMGYYSSTSDAFDQIQIGRQGTNGTVVLQNNYLPQGLIMNNWTVATVTGNLFAAQTTSYIVSLNQTQALLAAAWNGNEYLCRATGREFLGDSIEYGFSDWQSATGYDQDSTFAMGGLNGTKVFVRPNRYEPGRANIIVYNWDNLNSVPVDVSSVLAPGAAYELRNAQDFLSAPVLSGVFDGQPLVLPMTGLTAAVPNGPLRAPPPTGPTFNVFVLLPRSIRVELTAAENQAQIFWSTNFGNWILQFTESLSLNSGWTNDTNIPIIVGGQYVVTNLNLQNTRFYRLQAR